MSGGAADIHPYVLQIRRGNSLYVSTCFTLAEYAIKFHRRVEYRSLGYRRRGDCLFEYSQVSKWWILVVVATPDWFCWLLG